MAERIIAILREQSTPGMRRRASTFTDTGGKPLAFYSEKASIFRVKHKTPTNVKGATQFARALFELNIEGLCANTR